MDSSKVLAAVCVLAIIMGPVTSQSCTETYPCFTKLGTFVDGFNVLKSVLKSGKKADVGGNVLDGDKDILSGNTLDDLCRLMEPFTSCISDVFKSCGNETTSSKKSIRKQLQVAPPPQNNSGALQKQPGPLARKLLLFDNVKDALKAVTSGLRRRSGGGDGVGGGVGGVGVNGCVKLESWPLLGIIAALISSGFTKI